MEMCCLKSKKILNISRNRFIDFIIKHNIWDKIKISDPEQALYNGRIYPIPANVLYKPTSNSKFQKHNYMRN